MRVLSESWCFCNGGGKSERLKSSIFSTKSSAMVRVTTTSVASTSSSAGGVGVSGTGFLIHRNLLLTTHGNISSVAVAESAEIRLHNRVAAATLVPHRFFITSSVLDLTIVGLDYVDEDANSQGQQPHFLKTCSKTNIDLGSTVYLLGYMGKKHLNIGEGKVGIATDNLIKLSTDGVAWSAGSAGFDAQGNLAFMICDPMKLATSPDTKSSSTSSSSISSLKKDLPMQFGIPMLIICDWLNQHLESNLDELSKVKLPRMRLVSASHRTEHSSSSFSMRQIFKSAEPDIDRMPSSSQTIMKPRDPLRRSCSSAALIAEEGDKVGRQPCTRSHVQGIPTPEICESPKVTAVPVRKREGTQVNLLEINFPPSESKAIIPLCTANDLLPSPSSGENSVMTFISRVPSKEEKQAKGYEATEPGPNAKLGANTDVKSTRSCNELQSEVQSSSSPVATLEVRDAQISDVETMYSAETAESRNYTSPRERKFQPLGRSQSCMNYNRWVVHKYPIARKSPLEKQISLTQPKRIYSQGVASHGGNDYFSPTVSSIMKKRNNIESTSRYKQAAVHSSPRWMF